MASAILLGSGCGGGSGASVTTTTTTAAPARKAPSALGVADLHQARAFWAAQSAQGQLVLVRVCKAQVAADARRQASSDSSDDDSIGAGYDAANTVNEIDAEGLVPKVTASLRAVPNQSIGEACRSLVENGVHPTTVTLKGVREESVLGADTYVGKSTERLGINGTIEPGGDGAEFDIERRSAGDWEFLNTDRPDASGDFKITLRAYRDKSNLYRLVVRGAGAAQPRTVKIYFDRGPRTPTDGNAGSTAATPSALSFTGNGGKRLGTIKVSADSTLKWTNSGDLFSVTDDAGGIFVNSDAHKGDTAVDAGTYKNVVINAIGDWTITIAP
jgi:hypothetical protein